MQIEYLIDHQSLIPRLARWTYDTWGYWYPTATVNAYATMFRRRAQRAMIPETLIAFEDDQPVGMASLVGEDLPACPNLAPWLAAVYVLPEARDRGIGSLLVQAVMDEAISLGWTRLYLFTPDKVSFYRRVGWQEMSHEDHRGTAVTVMVYDFEAGG